MEIPCYQVDAFTTRPFAGNPAAVCVLDAFLDARTMQSIALEKALSETAFVAPRADGEFDLRWFTPTREVDLCGHATLATAHVLSSVLGRARGVMRFHTRSGVLTVEPRGETLAMDFPARPTVPCEVPAGVAEALGVTPIEAHRARDLVIVVGSAREVRAMSPDLARVAQIDAYAVTVTSRGDGEDADVDFVSRFFAPRQGVPEDPVTGSAHCTLAPFWAARLGRTVLRARQVSARGGEMGCELRGDRVTLEGSAVLIERGVLLL
ncbi:PhzF family phenazine biosynthesis protein [Sandaracinus amylolyticus]|uniref:PhzF family phenazine biosynthesis protein n=1 Tax=Sandaracinus amylolyticus TaxID=927083 RepID=UPI001F376443|nr:PhzF family phenazine biosynthesis protein [Sandaracinus amylolyticus]UJR78641.1 Phenazine biosynthesis protein PhzF [Sandaracinus amylolyticus]